MSERPTPIVDSCEFTVPFAGKVIVSKTARRLERERDEAREALADWENAAAHVEADHPDEKHCGCVPVLRKLLADSKRERDELRSIVEQRLVTGATIHQNANNLIRLNEKLQHELDEARNFSDKQAAKYAESKSNVRLLVKQLVLQIERPAYTVDEAVDKMFLMESAKKFINEVQ